MSRRTARGLISSKGGIGLAIIEENNDDRSIRYCSRQRCCASLHSMRETQREKPQRCKNIKSSSQSRSSSKLFSTTDHRKPCPEEQFLDMHTTRTPEEETTEQQTCHREGIDLSAINVGNESLRCCRLEENGKSNMTPVSSELRSLQGSSEGEANGHRTTTSSSRSSLKQIIIPRKQDHQASRYSIRCNTTSQTSRQSAMATSQDIEAGVSRNSFRKFRYSAKSDITSPAPSTDSGLNRRANPMGKRSSNGVILLATGKRTTCSVGRGNAGSSDGLSSNSTSSRNQHSRTSSLAVGTRRAAGRDARSTVAASPSNHVATAQLTQGELLSPITPTSCSSDDASLHNNTNGQPRSRDQHVFDRLTSHLPDSPLPQLDNNPAGVKEVLSELEKIDRHEYEVLSESERLEQYEYEQYLAEEESRLFFDSLHDQHSDMRMDIDDMSYEELLALGERIGTVSTALSEEVISKCLKKSNYVSKCLISGDEDDDEEDDIKCSVCQEEYVLGEKLGELGCQHCYHLTCIQQWLRLKNWCPICKATVSPTS